MANFEIKENGDFSIKRTNADRIRNMSDEELAEFLTRITDDAQKNVGARCNYGWNEWLQSESEE